MSADSRDKKVIADPIHGTMVFEPYLIKIIDHPYFQRLRHIKQLQGVEHVYPSGVHSRFAHSLGVCYLANRVLATLQGDGTNIDKLQRKYVSIAALCHDIGHGPFSHLYEIVVKNVEGKIWKHEIQSKEITKIILKELKIFEKDEVDEDEAIKTIQTMIEGIKVECMSDKQKKEAFLYQIVSNANSGVDVDKWDYFIRDTHACGFPSNFDKERAISMVRVCELTLKDRNPRETAKVLSFPIKDEINLYNMYGLRYTLHSKVLQHKVVCCVHEMIAEILKYADNTKMIAHKGKMFTTRECREIEKTELYCLMDDRLISTINNTNGSGDNTNGSVDNTDGSGDIKKAKQLIDRIKCRDFYQCIEEIPIPKNESRNQIKNQKQEEKANKIEEGLINETINKITDELFKHLGIYSEEQSKNEALREELKGKTHNDVFRIKMKVIDYGRKDKNPIHDVYFYGKSGNEVIEYVENNSPMIPKCFEAKTIQLICTLSKKVCRTVNWDTVKNDADVHGLIESMLKEIEKSVAAELQKEST